GLGRVVACVDSTAAGVHAQQGVWRTSCRASVGRRSAVSCLRCLDRAMHPPRGHRSGLAAVAAAAAASEGHPEVAEGQQLVEGSLQQAACRKLVSRKEWMKSRTTATVWTGRRS
ncbi:unnamed protein product, partial [Ectocarpus sp. 12 AP-2014]